MAQVKRKPASKSAPKKAASAYTKLSLTLDARGVAYVMLNRPEVHNAFDAQLIAELTRLFSELEKNAKVRLAVLCGSGKSFCAGGDLNWMRSMVKYSRAENIKDGHKLAAMYERLRFFKKPLIGRVHGAALGGGSGLVAVCDYVIAADDAKFGFTETRLGLLPGTISPYVIEKIGASNARAYFISGMRFGAETAKDIGMVQRIVSSDMLTPVCEEIVGEFLKAGPEACINAKKLIEDITRLSGMRKKLIDASVKAIADARVGKEGQEGMAALLGGRKPKWVQ